MAKICAIHQPNFFPWLGYFDKMQKADVFVYMDSVDYPKSGSGGMGSWTNRVKINVQGDARWVGCNIQRFSGSRLIKDVKISDSQPWRVKLLRTLEMNYKKSPNFYETISIIEPLIMSDELNISNFNISAIEVLRQYLGITVQTVRLSELDCEGSATELLVNVTRAVGCDAYMCGGGADSYQDDELFDCSGIKLFYQNYVPEIYGDKKNYIPGLSAIDYFMRRTV